MVGATQQRLVRRLVLGVATSGAALILLAGALGLSIEHERDMQDLRAQMESVPLAFSADLADALAQNDENSLKAQLGSLVALPDIAFAEVSVEGRVVASAGERTDPRALVRTFPITKIGQLTVVADHTLLRQRLWERIGGVLLVTVAFLVVTGFSGRRVLQKYCSEPLGRIRAHVQTLCADHTSVPLTLKRPEGIRDEMDGLVDDLNALSAHLQGAKSSWTSQIATLEAQNKDKERLFQEECSERAWVEGELRRQEEYFRLVLDRALVGIITTDEKGAVLSINAAAEGIFGYQSREVIGENVTRLMPEELAAHHAAYMEDYRNIGRVESSRSDGKGSVIGKGREVMAQRKNGEVFPAHLAVSELVSNGQRVFAGIVRDISLEKAVANDLIDAKRVADASNLAKSEFLASMSHELRTPLNAIIGFANAIRMEIFGPLENAKYREYLDDIYTSGEHLLELINDILDVSAIEAGKMTIHEEVVEVDKMVLTSLRLVTPRAQNGGVNLVFPKLEGLPRVRVDERRMKQILLNLLSNAVKFTPRKGKVTLEVERPKTGGLTFRVKDSGIGMNPEEIVVALTPFGQVDSSLARKYEGTGLGLPLTKSLVELHGGSLEIESEKGVGTIVSVTLPEDRVVTDE